MVGWLHETSFHMYRIVWESTVREVLDWETDRGNAKDSTQKDVKAIKHLFKKNPAAAATPCCKALANLPNRDQISRAVAMICTTFHPLPYLRIRIRHCPALSRSYQ